MAIASSEVASYPQGDPNPTLEFEEALLCRRETEYFRYWAFNIPPLSLACLTILFAAFITSGGTVFNKGPLGSWKFAGNLEIAMQCHDSHTRESLHEISHMHFELIMIKNSTMDESIYSKSCSRYVGMCSPHLKHLKSTNNTLTVKVNSAITKQQVLSLFQALKLLSNRVGKGCSAFVLPFFCQYVYPPCDDDGNTKLITQEQCINVRDKVCASEWRLTKATKYGSLLPDCETIDSNNNVSLMKKEENISGNLNCHHQFMEFCGVCLPLCATFSQYTDKVRITEDIILVTSAIIGIIGWAVVLVVAVKRRKEMLVYPQVLAVYATMNIFLFEVNLLISYAGGPKKLFCSHEALHLSLLNPTVYTRITGFVTHFFFLCGTVIWILYLFHLFLVVSFPIWSKFLSEQKWKIRLHVVEVIGSLVLCSIAPTVCISLSEYTIFRYPPLFVRPSGDAAFYSVVLPNAILTAIGVDITIYSLYSIRKNAQLHKRGKACLAFFSVPEAKILILLSYYTLFGIVQLINATIAINQSAPFWKDLLEYVECHLTGYNPICEDIRREFEKHLKPGLNVVSYIQFGFATWVNLLFAVKGEDIKWLMQKVASCYYMIISPLNKHVINSYFHTSVRNTHANA